MFRENHSTVILQPKPTWKGIISTKEFWFDARSHQQVQSTFIRLKSVFLQFNGQLNDPMNTEKDN